MGFPYDSQQNADAVMDEDNTNPTQQHVQTHRPWKAAALKACSSVGTSNLKHLHLYAQQGGTHRIPTSSAGHQRRHSLSSIPEDLESNSSDMSDSSEAAGPSTQPCSDLPSTCQNLRSFPALPHAPFILDHSGSASFTEQWLDDLIVLDDRLYFDILANEYDCCVSMGLSIRKCGDRRCTFHNVRRPNRWC